MLSNSTTTLNLEKIDQISYNRKDHTNIYGFYFSNLKKLQSPGGSWNNGLKDSAEGEEGESEQDENGDQYFLESEDESDIISELDEDSDYESKTTQNTYHMKHCFTCIFFVVFIMVSHSLID